MPKFLFDWKVHLFAVIFVIIAEFIGTLPIGPVPVFGMPIRFSLFPMLYAMLFGVIAYLLKMLDKDTVNTATPYIGIATMWLISKLAIGIGPQLPTIMAAGPAFVLQEFGNLGTAILAMPVAVFVFGMGKQSIGASFSKSREPSIAIMSTMYGLDSPQGQGVMGAYVVGTVLGAIFCAILASVVVGLGIFNPVALAMGAGSGSASMMTAFLAPMEFAYPDRWDELQAVAATSNIITGATGIYFSMFITIPVCIWMYKIMGGEERHRRKMAKKGINIDELYAGSETSSKNDSTKKAEIERPPLSTVWFERVRILVFSGIFGVIANTIFTSGNTLGNILLVRGTPTFVTPLQSAHAILLMFIPIVLGCIAYDLLLIKAKINLPIIIYISLIGIVLSIPGVPFAADFAVANARVGLLPLATPILAYAGISLGKDLKTFKEQGLGIIVITLLAFTGTYLGSAIIAHVYLAIAG